MADEVDEFLPGIGIVTAGTYNTSQLSLENNVFLRDADLQSFGLNFQYDFNNAWGLTVDLSHSSIDRSDIASFESNSAPGGAGSLNDTVSFRTDPDGRFSMRLLPIWRQLSVHAKGFSAVTA